MPIYEFLKPLCHSEALCKNLFNMKGGQFIGISTGVGKEAIVILKGLLRDESFIRSLIGRKTRATFPINRY